MRYINVIGVMLSAGAEEVRAEHNCWSALLNKKNFLATVSSALTDLTLPAQDYTQRNEPAAGAAAARGGNYSESFTRLTGGVRAASAIRQAENGGRLCAEYLEVSVCAASDRPDKCKHVEALRKKSAISVRALRFASESEHMIHPSSTMVTEQIVLCGSSRKREKRESLSARPYGRHAGDL
ncbi:hypothetical protein MHYP_G00062370 [Metynnis hypsauchen]